MSMSPPVLPGNVEWSGDNPFIYLSGDGTTENWATLATFFRIAVSPHGAGCVTIVLEDPYGTDGRTGHGLCISDNDELARYLIDAFVSRFPLFRPVEDLQDRL